MEKLAVSHLTFQGYETIIPMVEIVTFQGKTTKPLFPRYLFVAIYPGQSWVPIKSTIGVSYLISEHHTLNEGTPDQEDYKIPIEVRHKVIENIRSVCVIDETNPSLWRIKPNTHVKIISGPLAGFRALVDWTDGQRADLIMHMFGRKITPNPNYPVWELEVVS